MDETKPQEQQKTKQETPPLFSTLPDPEEGINRRLIPVSTSAVGRSVKLRDSFVLSGVLKTKTSSTTVSNTTTETILDSISLFKNELHEGMVIRLSGQGVYTTANGADTVFIRFGPGTTIVTSAINNMTSTAGVVGGAPWSFTWQGTVRSIGSSGTIIWGMESHMNKVWKSIFNSATTAIDTTANTTFLVTAEWSNALSDNSLTLTQFVAEILY